MSEVVEQLEAQLNDFDPDRRREALEGLLKEVEKSAIALPPPEPKVNLHCHTFYSYNGYGYSPTCFAWKARRAALAVAGIVDFDVLDAVDEFLGAARRLDLRACAGLETRVFVPEFASREITSPGEPGITYHMATGFTRSAVPGGAFLEELREQARQRTLGIIGRVNAALSPVELDFARDVAPLTPKGNATERHVCQAYELKAREIFPDAGERAAFWAEKLGLTAAEVTEKEADSPAFQAVIRSRMMKQGGPGYVPPDSDAFPKLADFNRFALEAGAIPTATWLDGTSPGEQALDELLDLHAEVGTAAVNIIPDRNWNIADPQVKRTKVCNLYEVVEKAMDRGLPIVVGTEMNAFGQRFTDDFSAPELQPVVSAFLEGAYIQYAHTVMSAEAGMGYLSPWAMEAFPQPHERNAFFARLGEALEPRAANRLAGLTPDVAPAGVLEAVGVFVR